MNIQIGDIVDVTFVTGFLSSYRVEAVPGNNQIYWEFTPVDDPTQFTVVGPSMISIVVKQV